MTTALSAEMRVVLWAIAVEGDSGGAADGDGSAQRGGAHGEGAQGGAHGGARGLPGDRAAISWPRVTQLAIQHGVLPIVYKHLKRQQAIEVPPDVLNKHRELYLMNLGHNVRATKKLLDMLDLLSGHGFEAVPFKGPVVAVQAFGDIGMRGFCDLDLLIRNEDFAGIYDLLESRGYTSLKPRIGRMKSVWKASRRDVEFRGNGCVFDLHQQVTQGPRFLGLKHEREGLAEVELESQKAPSLNITDTILMLALHGTHHGWSILKMTADLAHVVHRNRTEIDWDALIDKARRMGCLRMVLIGLLLSREFCGLEIPREVEECVGKDRRAVKLAGYFRGKTLESQKSGLIPVWALPRSLDSPYHKARYMAHFIFHPTDLDVLAVRLPAFLYPLYYLVRPVRLAMNAVGGAVEAVRAKREARAARKAKAGLGVREAKKEGRGDARKESAVIGEKESKEMQRESGAKVKSRTIGV